HTCDKDSYHNIHHPYNPLPGRLRPPLRTNLYVNLNVRLPIVRLDVTDGSVFTLLTAKVSDSTASREFGSLRECKRVSVSFRVLQNKRFRIHVDVRQLTHHELLRRWTRLCCRCCRRDGLLRRTRLNLWLIDSHGLLATAGRESHQADQRNNEQTGLHRNLLLSVFSCLH